MKMTLSKRSGYRAVLIAAMFAFLMGMLVMGICTHIVKANSTPSNKITYYTSVQIQSGDSLYSIASKFDHDGTLDDFVDDILRLNHLKSHTIHAGSYILIPYQADGI